MFKRKSKIKSQSANVPELNSEAESDQNKSKPESSKNNKSLFNWSPKQVGLIACGVAGIVIGIFLFVNYWKNPQSPLMGMAGIILVGGGVVLLWRNLKRPETRHVVVGNEVHNGKVLIKNANCLEIYAKRSPDGKINIAEKIVFSQKPENELLGQPQQCLNDGKWYHVHIWDLDIQQLIAFILPDAKFVDPSIMARYLELPSQRKYLKHRETLMKFIGPGLLALANVAAFITIIALAG